MANPLSHQKVILIYDFDATLVDTRAFTIFLLQQSWRNLELPNPMPTAGAIDEVCQHNVPYDDIFRLTCGDHWEAVLAEYKRLDCDAAIPAIPGGPAVVAALHEQGIIQGILTSRPNMTALRLVNSGYDGSHFAFICIPTISKPNPQAFDSLPGWVTILVKRHHFEMVYLGDHPHDWAASINIRRAVVSTGYHDRISHLSNGVPNHHILKSITDYPAWLSDQFQPPLHMLFQ